MAEQQDFLSFNPLDVENFIKVNHLQQIKNPMFFSGNNIPTPDGLLSNEIFGINKEQRTTIFGYIDLGGPYFINPLMYTIWQKLDRKIIDCVYGNGTYRINEEDGKLILDPDGETGIDFLYKNIDKFNWKKNNSRSRNENIDFLNKYRNYIFTKKMIVIPPFYRDVDTSAKYVSVGEINKLYDSLIQASNGIREQSAYEELGLSVSNSVKGRVQDIMLKIYDYLTRGFLNGKQSTSGAIAGKLGILRRTANSKTTDYSARLVISAPNLKVENMDDLLIDADHCAVPMASICTNFFPYILSYIRNFFMNQFQTEITRYTLDSKGKEVKVNLMDWRVAFPDEVLTHQIDEYIHGFSGRFNPIKYPVERNNYGIESIGFTFTGNIISDTAVLDKDNPTIADLKSAKLTPLQERPMTWCDLLYMAAVEVTRDKTVLITRYPIDSCYNQFPLLINVSSTHRTEPIVVNGVLYKHYPRIRKEDIGVNTSNLFIDTLNVPNIYLGSMGADYDGDQVTVKSVYSVEANQELRDQINSKRHYISLGGKNIMETTNEGAMVLYALTMSLNNTSEKFTEPEF